MTKISVKRTVIVKTILTDFFRESLKTQTSEEIQALDRQITELELKIKQTHENLQYFSGQFNTETLRQTQNSLVELNQRFQQLLGYKQELMEQCEAISQKSDGEEVVTGVLDNYVELKVGDKLYEKIKNAEIVVKDGVIKRITK